MLVVSQLVIQSFSKLLSQKKNKMEGERRDGERTPHCEIKLYCGNTVTHLTLRDKIILGEYSYDY